MKAKTWVQIRRVFERAVALEEAERPAFLDSSCAGEPEVRREVERLLSEDSDASGFLEPLAPGAIEARPEPWALEEGSRIGPYEIRRVLGSGGMGTVYEAVQDRPHRSVALKTLRTGFASAARRKRFEFEAEVLGSMRHPGIAQIYDSGAHDVDGRSFPYFAMEYVEGARDLFRFAREERLPQRARVELFVRICDAVHHGHTKGVVHRDLKAGNVLIDREGRPKVIDFGVARATAPELAAAAAVTTDGQLVGTLHNMSPEQITGGDVDTRSDVYSIGCMLYELLTGTTPFQLADEPLALVTRIIAEEEPRRPEGLPADLVWILQKALAKEPDRRFSSAAELAADLSRFLRHEPVLAGPPSARYRMVKLVRRNRVLLSSIAAVVVALGIGLLRARREAHVATEALEVAQREAQKAEGVSGFLRSMLTAAGPLSHGSDARVLDVLGEAAGSLDRELAGMPETRAIVENVLGEAYSELRLLEVAEAHLAEARAYVEGLPPDDPLRLDVLTNVARLEILKGHPIDAEEPLRELEVLALERLGEDHRLTLRIQGTLCNLLLTLGRLEQAEGCYDGHLAALERFYGPDHGEVIGFLGGRALVWMKLGRTEEARAELERVLALAIASLPEDHFRILNAKNNLANAYVSAGRPEEAEPLLRECLAQVRRVFGEDHPFVVTALGGVGICLGEEGRVEEAASMLEEALELSLAVYGADASKTAWIRWNLERIR